MLSRDLHFGVCCQASSSFSNLIAKQKQSLSSMCPGQVKRPRLSQAASFGSFDFSNRLSALSELSLDSISNRTFVRKPPANGESTPTILNRTVTKSKVVANRKPSLNKTITKATLRREESKESIMNRTVVKSKKAPARESTLLNLTITHHSIKDNQNGSPLKKIARPTISRIDEQPSAVDESVISALNRTITLGKISVPSEVNELPADTTNSTTLSKPTLSKPKSVSTKTSSKPQKKTSNKTVKTSKKKSASANATFTTEPTVLVSKQEAADYLQDEKMMCGSPLDGTVLDKESTLLGASLSNLTALSTTPMTRKYNLRQSVRSVKKNYAC